MTEDVPATTEEDINTSTPFYSEEETDTTPSINEVSELTPGCNTACEKVSCCKFIYRHNIFALDIYASVRN